MTRSWYGLKSHPTRTYAVRIRKRWSVRPAVQEQKGDFGSSVWWRVKTALPTDCECVQGDSVLTGGSSVIRLGASRRKMAMISLRRHRCGVAKHLLISRSVGRNGMMDGWLFPAWAYDPST